MEDYSPENQNGNGFYNKNKEDIIQDTFDDSFSRKDTAQYSYSYQDNHGFGYNDFKPQKPQKPKRKTGTATVVLAVVLSILIGAASGFGGAYFYLKGQKSNSHKTVIQNGDDVNITVNESIDSIAQAVAKKAEKSVVGIRTTTSVINFFGGSTESPGEGSGVIYSSDGYIITNYHVIEDVVESTRDSKIEVFLNGNSTDSFPATVVGYNISNDIAVIKINADGLMPAEIGDSSNLSVGQYVVTIGCPGGLEFMGSVTYGIISGLDRVVSSNSNVKLIQTDAAINPGNSGGALLNSKGQLIGINSSKIVAEEYEAMGFSIPINTVVEKVKSIIARENSPEPYIGITLSNRYTGSLLKQLGYPAGAVVMSVDEDSPAGDSGIRRGDIITEFAGREITEYTDVSDVLNDLDVGKTVKITIYRSGRSYTADIKIGANS